MNFSETQQQDDPATLGRIQQNALKLIKFIGKKPTLANLCWQVDFINEINSDIKQTIAFNKAIYHIAAFKKNIEEKTPIGARHLTAWNMLASRLDDMNELLDLNEVKYAHAFQAVIMFIPLVAEFLDKEVLSNTYGSELPNIIVH